MSLLPLILAKRAGRALSLAEIKAFVDAVAAGSVPDYQISALLMAIYFQGMDTDETIALTGAIAESGETHSWAELPIPTADKHSTGGVGDKLSLIIAPLAACLGMAVPMLSGRGLGFTGGTLDKLESIPGFVTDLPRDRFEKQMADLSCAFIGQSPAIAPADRRLYALRDVTGTVESLPLIVSSILGKKIAAGPESLVIDLKVGRGAFMPDMAKAKKLGEALRETAMGFGRRCSILFTAMDAPLGASVGNGPEVREAMDVLSGCGPAPIAALSRQFVHEMGRLAGVLESDQAGAERVAAALAGGYALERFLAVVRAQGGSLDANVSGWGLPDAPYTATVSAASKGRLLPADAGGVGRLTVKLGAGRRRAEDSVDPRAGCRFMKPWGAEVERGDVLAVVEGSDSRRVADAAAALEALLEIGEGAEESGALLIARLDDDGFRSEPATR